ncbi:MAG: SirB2 family protein [Pseudomonadota bacterium]
MLFELAKHIHLIAISLSITGFILRSYFLLSNLSPHWFKSLPVKLPHYIDVMLLASALIMVWQWQVNPFVTPFLAEKITALCAYILFGMLALHWAKTTWLKILASGLAIACFAYIVFVATTKNTILF